MNGKDFCCCFYEETCSCSPGIKSFRQQIMQSKQKIMDKALAINFKNTIHLYNIVTKENPSHRFVNIFSTVSTKSNSLLCGNLYDWKSWLVTWKCWNIWNRILNSKILVLRDPNLSHINFITQIPILNITFYNLHWYSLLSYAFWNSAPFWLLEP